MLYVAVSFLVVVVLSPYLWLFVSSLSTRSDLTRVPLSLFPPKLNFESYTRLFAGGTGATDAASQFRRAVLNSLIVALVVTLVSVFVGSLAAYCLVRFRFRGRNFVSFSVITPQLLPPIALVIPLYLIVRKLGLLDTRLALVMTYTSFVLPLVIWLMTGHFRSIPLDIEEAARIDGCSRIGALFRVVLPLVSPGIAATFVFAFIIAWNEFFYALIFSSTLNSKTLSVLVEEFSSKFGEDYVLMSAAGVLASLPPVVLALVFQRYIVQGLTAGAVKG
jgi:multiple sugar transport system permease protein